MLIDFNCRLIEKNKFKSVFNDFNENVLDNQKIINDISLMNSCGFHKMICQVPYDTDYSSKYFVKCLNNKANEINKFLRKHSLNNTRFAFYPQLLLNEYIEYIPDINRLCLPYNHYIFTKLPYNFRSFDDIQSCLNSLLYKCKLLPLFSDFQIYCELLTIQQIYKIISISNFAFQFSLNCIYNDNCLRIINDMAKNGNLVVLGTSCEHNEFNSKIIKNAKEKLRKSLSDENYYRLILNSHKLLSN